MRRNPYWPLDGPSFFPGPMKIFDRLLCCPRPLLRVGFEPKFRSTDGKPTIRMSILEPTGNQELARHFQEQGSRWPRGSGLVVAEAPHRAQRRVHCRLGTKTRTVRDVACDHLGINALNPDAWATPLEPPSPPIQPRLGVRHRLRTDSPSRGTPRYESPVTGPISSSPSSQTFATVPSHSLAETL